MSKITYKFVAFVILALILIPLPFYSTPVIADWSLRLASLMMLSISWNLAASAGLISLGHSIFWGLGIYVAILASNKIGLGFAATIIPAIAIGMLVGAILAVITGRLRGFFFAISTLALSEGLRVIAVMTPELTGGGEGVYIQQSLRPESPVIASFAVFCAFAVFAISWAVVRSRYHYAFRAMRNNEAASEMFGINSRRFRVGILALAGGMTSLAGGINAWFGGFADPGIAFDLHITILAQVAPILGGLYTLMGPVIGALAALVISEGTRIWFGSAGLSIVIYGLILCLCILYLPNGIWHQITKLRQKKVARETLLAKEKQ